MNPLESYLETRARRVWNVAPQEPPNVAARRRDWDEAKRSGDPDAMTRTANALLRAVEGARAHVGSHETTHAAANDGARDPTIGEVLNPGAPAKDGNEMMRDVRERALAEGPMADWLNTNRALPRLTVEGEMVPIDGAPDPESDADVPPRETTHIEADDVIGEETPIAPVQAQVAAEMLKRVPEDHQSEILWRLRERFGGSVGQIADHLVGTTAREIPDILPLSGNAAAAPADAPAHGSGADASRQPEGSRTRGGRPSDRDIADARVLAAKLPINSSIEPTPVWYVRTTPDAPLTVVEGSKISRTESTAQRGGPPEGAVMGGHGHVRRRLERGDKKQDVDDYNEAQGYPGPKDFAAVKSTGIPEIVRTPDRVFIIYLDEKGRPVAEVVAGAPFPPNVEERIEKNKYMKENMGGQSWSFRNGPQR